MASPSSSYLLTYLEARDFSRVRLHENAIRKTGVAGVIRPDKSTVQVIIGTKVQFVYEEMKRLL